MKKAILALFLVLTLASAYDLKGNSFLSNTSPSQRNFEFVDESCWYAVKSFNRGIRQLTWDVRAQSNQWVVYADLDSLDEISYYLRNSCSAEDFQLLSKVGLGLTEPEQQACTDLMAIVDSLLEQKRTEEFRGGYKAGIALSRQALELGPNIADGCRIRLVTKEQEAKEKAKNVEEPTADTRVQEQDETSDEDDSDENQNEESDESGDVEDIRIRIVREKNGRKEKYTIDYRPSDHGEPEVSVTHNVAGEQEETVSDWNDLDWNNEEWNAAEWTNSEWATGRWNNEEWANGEWSDDEWSSEEWAHGEWSDSEWSDDEWGTEAWNNEDNSDESSDDSSDDASDEFPFFYQVNPDASTDSGSYWKSGGYKRYYGGDAGGKAGTPPKANFGDFYWAI